MTGLHIMNRKRAKPRRPDQPFCQTARVVISRADYRVGFIGVGAVAAHDFIPPLSPATSPLGGDEYAHSCLYAKPERGMNGGLRTGSGLRSHSCSNEFSAGCPGAN
jgi:hypothetical protein